jgi:hypothetical protein
MDVSGNINIFLERQYFWFWSVTFLLSFLDGDGDKYNSELQ